MSPRDVARTFPARQYTLPSGLRVVIDEDPSAGLVGVVWVVDAGAVDDPAFHGSLPHVVEHLAFELHRGARDSAPDAASNAPWERLRDLGGIDVNGFTSLEKTQFQTFGPRSQLDRLVAVELSRMADPLGAADDDTLAAELAKQRVVLREERNVRDDMALAEQRLLWARIFPAPHPYAAAVSGDLDAAAPAWPAAAVRAFVRNHYQPQKMTLVLSGAIPRAWDAHLFEMMPAALAGDRAAPRAPERRPMVATLPPLDGSPAMARARTINDKPYLRIGWWLPGTRAVDAVPIKILGEVISLALAVAIEQGELPNALFSIVNTSIEDRGSVLECIVVLREAGRADTVRERAVEIVSKRALSSLRLYGAVQQASLKWVTLSEVLGLQALQARTIARAELAHAQPGGDAGLGPLIEAVNRVSVGQLSDLADRYLTPAAARSILFQWSLPPRAPAQMAAASLANGSAPPERNETPSARPADAGPRPAPATHSPDEVRAAAATPPAGSARAATLANGLTVIAMRRPGLPFVSVTLGFRSTPTRDAPPGIWLAARFGRQYENIWGPLEYDLLSQERTDDDDVRDELSTYASLTGAALTYLADKTKALQVKWPDERFERWSSTVMVDEKTRGSWARRRFAAALWGDNPYGLAIPIVDVMERSQAEVEAWINRVERPENGALIIVGDVDPGEALALADWKLRGSWSDRPAPRARLTAPPAAEPRPRVGPLPIQFNEMREQRAASITFGCLLPPARTPRDAVVGDFLGELMEERLFEHLRIHEGKSYGHNVRHTQLWGGSNILKGIFDIEDQSVVDGTALIESYLTAGGQSIADEAAIERVRWRLALATAARYGTNAEVARALFTAWKAGWPPSALDEVPNHLATIGASELEAAMKVCRASAVVSVNAAVTVH